MNQNRKWHPSSIESYTVESKQYICKCGNPNDNDNDKSKNNSTEQPEKDENVPNSDRTVTFEREQSKFCITEDINETPGSETERITAVPDDKLNCFERLNIMQNKIPSRKRKKVESS